MKHIPLLMLFVAMTINPIVTIAQDVDSDGINDQFEYELALNFAPEWRFGKKTNWGIINSSNQNIDKENYPSSVDYLIYDNSNLPKLQFYYAKFNASEHPFSNINAISSILSTYTGQSASDPVFGDDCDEGNDNNPRNALTLEFDDNLPGEPNTFPTYFHCGKISNTSVSITYFLFSAFDNKHEFGSGLIGNHRGDWERFTMVIENLDLQNGNLNGNIKYLRFSQHGSTKFYLNGNSGRLRFVNGTHPKMYVALTSHAIYPEPGILFDYRVDWWPDTYDDIFLGNGLIVQSWNPQRSLINLGEKNIPMSAPQTSWVQYKGRWGGSDSPFGPSCKWSHDLGNIPSWDDWINENASGDNYLDQWNSILLDCDPKYSTNYVPSPGYNCSVIVDCRKTCEVATGSDIKVWGNLVQAVNNLPATQAWQVCLMPCHYPEPITITKPMVLKAPEGPVVLGAH